MLQAFEILVEEHCCTLPLMYQKTRCVSTRELTKPQWVKGILQTWSVSSES